MKNKKWILVVGYLVVFATIFGYAGYRYYLYYNEINVLTSEKQQILQNMEELEAEIVDVETQVSAIQGTIDERNLVISAYEATLSGIDEYESQLENIKTANEALLNYVPLTVEYNYDEAVAEENAQQSAMAGLLSDVFSNPFTSVVEASEDEQAIENINVMVEVNETAEDMLLYSAKEVQSSIDNLNSCIGVYEAFLQSEDVEEEFVNLQVLNMLTETTPLEDAQFQDERDEIFSWMVKHYYYVDATCRMYEVVLTDTTENRAYIQNMKDELVEMETIFDQYGVSYEYTEDLDYAMMYTQQTIKEVMDEIGSKNVVLPSIPIGNQRFTTFSGELNGAKVYRYYKDTQDGEKIVYIGENNVWRKGNCDMIFDLTGEPVYVELESGYVYFYKGHVLESTTTLDTTMIYEQACILYENIDTMTNDEYFANTLTGR